MPDQQDLRASDEQRERAAQEIREHFAAGRLTDDELSDRVQAAYARPDPGRAERGAGRPAQAAGQPRRAEGASWQPGGASSSGGCSRRPAEELGTIAICTAIWVASGASGFFWPIFVVLAVLIPLLRNGWRLYGPAPELERVERELEARQRKDQLRRELRGDAQRPRRPARRGGTVAEGPLALLLVPDVVRLRSRT